MTLLDDITLKAGGHQTREDGLCVMEAVAWLAGEEHTDQPKCASPIIRSFAIGLNDAWDDNTRQRLLPYAKLMVNTADGLDDQRGLMCADWLIRTCLPAWLRVAGLADHADRIAAHPEFTDWSMLGPLTADLLQPVKTEAAAAWAAAGAAAGDAAWAAARAAARAAAGDAAWAAAGDALQPTVEDLQDSALDLLDRMCRL